MTEQKKVMDKPLHRSTDEEPVKPGYMYAASGVGVRKDLVDAVLGVWAIVSPTGDPAQTLRSVNDGALNRIDNLARMAVVAVAEALEAKPE